MVELVVAKGAELDPELPYTEDEAAPETIDDWLVDRAPKLLLEALEPVESRIDVGEVPMMPPELRDDVVGNGGRVEPADDGETPVPDGRDVEFDTG
jgi:hypothetical protein